MSPRDVDCSHLFPLERIARRFPRLTFAALLAAFSAPAWVAGALAITKEWT